MKVRFKATPEKKTHLRDDLWLRRDGQTFDIPWQNAKKLFRDYPDNFESVGLRPEKLGPPVHKPLKLSEITVLTIHYWPSDVLERCLLADLPKEVEFIKIDNVNNKKFTSGAKALNYGIRKAKNDVVICAHEDIKFGKGWFDDFIKQECTLKDWGILGIVGWDFDGEARWGLHYKAPYKVKFLDECCLIVDRKKGLWFDEETFKHFHRYGADFCYQCHAKGLGVYVVAGVADHAVRGYDHDQAWFNQIGIEQDLFDKKWRKDLKVDILMPTFNRPNFLRRAIKSVLGQQSPHWELHVYNDGSHYDFGEIRREFIDKRIYWLGKEQVSDEERCEMGHVSKVRNYLAQATHNELLLWLDDDDWLWPEAVEGAIEYFREHPEVKIAYGKMSAVFENTDPEAPREERIMWPGVPLQDPYCKLGTPQVIMRREVLGYAKWPTENLPQGTLDDAVFWRTLGGKYTFHPADVWMANVYYRSSKCHHALTEQGRQLEPVRE